MSLHPGRRAWLSGEDQNFQLRLRRQVFSVLFSENRPLWEAAILSDSVRFAPIPGSNSWRKRSPRPQNRRKPSALRSKTSSLMSGRNTLKHSGRATFSRRFRLPFPETEIPLPQQTFERNLAVLKLQMGGKNFPQTVERQVMVLLHRAAAFQETLQNFRPIVAADQQTAQIQQIVPSSLARPLEKLLDHFRSRQPPRSNHCRGLGQGTSAHGRTVAC